MSFLQVFQNFIEFFQKHIIFLLVIHIMADQLIIYILTNQSIFFHLTFLHIFQLYFHHNKLMIFYMMKIINKQTNHNIEKEELLNSIA